MKTLLLLSSLLATFVSSSVWAYGPENPTWRSVNDTVMGGVSQGGPVDLDEGEVRFAGILSLDNNGGFSSIRSDSPDYAINQDGSFLLTVRGDGRTYSFDLRTRVRQGAFAYQQKFRTIAGVDMEIRLPLSGFSATAFGRNMPMATPLDPSQIASVGIMLADKKPGPFRLDLLSIEFEPATSPNVHDPAGLIALAIHHGVPLYNRGDADACAAVYETTLHALMMMPDSAVPASAKKQMRKDMKSMDESSTPSEKAWALRHALDRAHHAMASTE
jgi:monofunctional biosynthetic peptidoglycan transglycosylase